jgi:hypothetical protein
MEDGYEMKGNETGGREWRGRDGEKRRERTLILALTLRQNDLHADERSSVGAHC